MPKCNWAFNSQGLWKFILLELTVLSLLALEHVVQNSPAPAAHIQTSAGQPVGSKSARMLEHKAGRKAVPGVYRQGIYTFGEERLVLCSIPKVASRVVLQLGARVDGVRAWHSNQLGDIQAYALTKKPISNAELTGGTIPKVTMVRDPATRLLSGYLSKLETPDWPYASSYAPNCPNKTTSFEQFIEVLERVSDMMGVNRHFRPQHLLCGFAHGVKYDCIIKYEDRSAGWKSCLTKLKLWDEFGATGWGPNGTEAIFEAHELYLNDDVPKVFTVTVSPSLFEKYYTPDLLERVQKLFRKDYQFLGATN